MSRLWAPWRVKYIKSKKSKKCIFCCADTKAADRHVLFKTKLSICMLNIFPYNNGHLMVAPRRHVRDLTQLEDREALDLFRVLCLAQDLLDQVLKPHGYNIGINISETAGAGVPGHIHIHIVPRWKGDTNFMPVVCTTKVISQSLHELYRQLKHAYSKSN